MTAEIRTSDGELLSVRLRKVERRRRTTAVAERRRREKKTTTTEK